MGCKAIECGSKQCSAPKPMLCMDIVSGKNYGKNMINTDAYIQQLENIIHTISKEPK